MPPKDDSTKKSRKTRYAQVTTSQDREQRARAFALLEQLSHAVKNGHYARAITIAILLLSNLRTAYNRQQGEGLGNG